MILAHAFPGSGPELHDLLNAWTLDPFVNSDVTHKNLRHAMNAAQT